MANEFGGDNLRFEFHLAPPLLARTRPGDRPAAQDQLRPVDDERVPAARAAARACAARRSTSSAIRAERRTERQLIADYEAMLDEMLAKLTPDNHPLAVGLAAIPEKIRGFGHVKARHLAAAKADEAALLEQFRSGRRRC